MCILKAFFLLIPLRIPAVSHQQSISYFLFCFGKVAASCAARRRSRCSRYPSCFVLAKVQPLLLQGGDSDVFTTSLPALFGEMQPLMPRGGDCNVLITSLAVLFRRNAASIAARGRLQRPEHFPPILPIPFLRDAEKRPNIVLEYIV